MSKLSLAKTSQSKPIKLKVASPCDAKWDEMSGDEAVRFCGACEKNVFQISNMSTEQVEEFFMKRKGLRTCVRFYQRADGTLLTSDCSVGKAIKRKKRFLKIVGGAALSASALGLNYGLQSRNLESNPDNKVEKIETVEVVDKPESHEVILGEVGVEMPVVDIPAVEEEVYELMGDIDIAYEPG